MIRKLICRYWYRRHKWGKAYPMVDVGGDPNGNWNTDCQRCKITRVVKRRKAKGEV